MRKPSVGVITWAKTLDAASVISCNYHKTSYMKSGKIVITKTRLLSSEKRKYKIFISDRSSFKIIIEQAVSIFMYMSTFFFKSPLKVLSSHMVTEAVEKWPNIFTLKETSFYCLKAFPLLA